MHRHFLTALMLLTIAAGCTRPETREEASAPPSVPATETAPAPAPEPTGSAEPSAAANPADVTGAYFSMEPLPAEFAEIGFLSLATIDENAAPAPLNGFLRPEKQEAEDYLLVDPKLEGGRLSFVTQDHGGISWSFEGLFEVAGNFPENPPSYETVVLSGKLVKLRAGKSIATTPVKFRYEAGG